MTLVPTSDEVNLLSKLREQISDLKLSREENEDKNLVRWLRARKQNLDATELMIRKNTLWKNEVLKTLDFEVVPDGYVDLFPWNICGFDKQNNPVICLPLGVWDIRGAIARGEKNVCIESSIKLTEVIWRCCQRQSIGKPWMGQLIVIYDMKNLSWYQATCYQASQLIFYFIRMLEQNYPELLGKGFIVNAPAPFQICYKMFGPMVDERTFNKIKVLGSDPTIWRKEIGDSVDFDQFPQKYGGDGDNHLKMVLNLDGSVSLLS